VTDVVGTNVTAGAAGVCADATALMDTAARTAIVLRRDRWLYAESDTRTLMGAISERTKQGVGRRNWPAVIAR
jgi:hypothetical protein